MADARLERIKTLTIIALVSDDELMERLVLKGGNALRLIHSISVRQSLDLDFSIDGDLGPLAEVHAKIDRLLQVTFAPEGLIVMDVRMSKVPPNIGEDTLGDFWGGYTLEFKVIDRETYDRLASKPDKRRQQAVEVGPAARRTFVVDLSKHEYCVGKVRHDLEGYTVFAYSPLMIACEKVRAICQQMAEYRKIVKSKSQKPRARDFFDIHNLVANAGVDLSSDEAWRTLIRAFAIKRVPLALLARIDAERDFHREDFFSVRDTVEPSHQLLEFDFYVDFLVEQLRPLQPRWEKQPPVL